MGIARSNKNVPGMRSAFRLGVVGYGFFTRKSKGRFRHYFFKIANDRLPIKKLPVGVLLDCFTNFIDDEMDHKDAVKLFLVPLADALTEHMRSGELLRNDGVPVGSAEIGRLVEETKKFLNSGWLNEEEGHARTALQQLAEAASIRYVSLCNDERRDQPPPAEPEAGLPQVG